MNVARPSHEPMAKQLKMRLENSGSRAGGRGGRGGASAAGGGGPEEPAALLHEEARSAATSTTRSRVITSRALPDVRDGLKPVQRRILYAMSTTTTSPGRQVPEVRQGRRRRHGPVPPARRHRHLRRAGAHGAGLLAALPARRRARQLRLARRRRGRGDALHRVPAAAARDRAARRARARTRRLPPQLRRHAPASRSCCRPASRTC